MFPRLILMPIFIGTGIFWVFGPEWSWIAFIVIFALVIIATLAAGITRIVLEAPSAARSMSSTFSFLRFLATAIAVGIIFNRQLWELILITGVFVVSLELLLKLRNRLQT